MYDGNPVGMQSVDLEATVLQLQSNMKIKKWVEEHMYIHVSILHVTTSLNETFSHGYELVRAKISDLSWKWILCSCEFSMHWIRIIFEIVSVDETTNSQCLKVRRYFGLILFYSPDIPDALEYLLLRSYVFCDLIETNSELVEK